MKNPNRRQAKSGFEQGELFESHFTAVYPGPTSQAGIALASLTKAERLRQAGWLHVGWRLAAAIHTLKKMGWPVMSLPIHVPGRKRPIAEYSLPTWVLRAIGGAK